LLFPLVPQIKPVPECEWLGFEQVDSSRAQTTVAFPHGCVTIPLVTIPLVTIPLVTIPLVTIPLVTIPLVTIPLVTIPLVTIPLMTIPLVTIPLVTNMFAASDDCFRPALFKSFHNLLEALTQQYVQPETSLVAISIMPVLHTSFWPTLLHRLARTSIKNRTPLCSYLTHPCPSFLTSSLPPAN